MCYDRNSQLQILMVMVLTQTLLLADFKTVVILLMMVVLILTWLILEPGKSQIMDKQIVALKEEIF